MLNAMVIRNTSYGKYTKIFSTNYDLVVAMGMRLAELGGPSKESRQDKVRFVYNMMSRYGTNNDFYELEVVWARCIFCDKELIWS